MLNGKIKIFFLLLILSPTAISNFLTRRNRKSSDNVGVPQTKQVKQYPAFGRAMRSEFLLNEDFVLLDHGAYGTIPKATRTGLREFQDRAEANPDLWFRREARGEVDKVIAQLAALMNADPEDLVMIPNTTSGMNAIFRSLMLRMRERILHFTTIYGSMGSIIEYLVDTNMDKNVTALIFNVTYPISNDEIVANFDKFLQETHDPLYPIRIALVDHITSVPGAIVPIERLIPILRRYGIAVLIDGAHAIGQVPIDIKSLAPDYYITNCHKWLYGARGSAVMFVDKRHQGEVHPAHINAAYQKPSGFQEEFFWTGTMDYSAYMSVTAALEFRREIGGEEAIQKYTHDLAKQGGAFLAEKYNTEVLQEEGQIGSMVDVRLPINNPNDPVLTTAWWIDTMLFRYPSVYAPSYKHNGDWWVRHSVQIYNDMDDFELAADVFLEICKEINSKNGTIGNGAKSSLRSAAISLTAASTVLAFEL